MKTIYDYVKEYGKYSFLEKDFTEVDNLILSFLSYVDFRDIVPPFYCGSIRLKEASRIVSGKFTNKDLSKYIMAVREATDLLKELAKHKRYRNLVLYNYEYKVTKDMQFGALCIKLPNRRIFISFEGTDGYVSGWKEDFMLVNTFPLKAHLEAIKYINKSINIFSPRIYIGGHSKGGNLALVAAMYCKKYIYPKIINVFSNDGPGLRQKELSSYRYRMIRKKYVHIMPEEGFVGILCRNEDNYVIIKSSNKKFMQHDVISWQVNKDKFVRGEMSEFTKRCRRALDNWIDNMPKEKQEKFIELLFQILEKAEIKDLMEIRQATFRNLVRIYREARNIDKESEKLISTCFKDLYLEWRK